MACEEKLSPDQQRLAAEHTRLVAAVARRVFPHNPSIADEFIDAGYIGLCKAARSFDAARGCAFEVYASHRIAGEIRDCAREARGGRTRRPVHTVPIDEPFGKDDDATLTWGDIAAFARHDDGAGAELIGEMADHRSRLPERARLVLEEYYDHGRTLAEIGTLLGVTESRVSQLHRQAIERLREAMGVEVDRRPPLERILAELDREPLEDPSGRAIRRLASRTKSCQESCAAILRTLHRMGMVVREQGNDARAYGRIDITDLGRQHLAQLAGRLAA